MSRNDKIRLMASKLPPFPKLKTQMVEIYEEQDDKMVRKLKSQIQRDSFGRIIYVDHFRELKAIQVKHLQKGLKSNDPIILAEWANYSKMVMSYDMHFKKKRERKIILFLVITTIVLAFAIKYSQFSIK